MHTEVTGYPDSVATAKAQAKRLMAAMGGKVEITHSQALELVAKLHGANTWAEMSANLNDHRPSRSAAIHSPAVDDGLLIMFTEHDYYRSLSSLWESDAAPFDMLKNDVIMDIIGGCIQPAIREISPQGVTSTLVIREVEKAILGKTAEKLRYLDLEGNLSPIALRKSDPRSPLLLACEGILSRATEIMLLTAHRRDPAVRAQNALRASRNDDVLLLDDVGKLRSWSHKVIKGGLPEINRRHTLAITSRPDVLISDLRKAGKKVCDVFTRQDLDGMCGTLFHQAFTMPNFPKGVRSVNPVSVLKNMANESGKGFTKGDEPTVIVTSLTDMEKSYGPDLLLAHARAIGGHFIVVVDKDHVSDLIFPNVDHVWRG